MARTVILTAEAFEKIIQYLGQYSNPLLPKNKCVESFGFLFCRQTPTYYIIEDAVGVATGERAAVELKAEELAIIELLTNQRPELFLGGWVHSHPGWGLFFSNTDEQNQMFYQQMNEDGLGIVWDYTLVGKDGKGLGFVVLRLDNPNREGYSEVPFKLLGFSLQFVERIFSPLGYDKQVLSEAWKDLEHSGALLATAEASRVQAQMVSIDIDTLVGAENPSTPDVPVMQSSSSIQNLSLKPSPAPSTADKVTSLKEMGILHFTQEHYAQAAKELQAALSLNRADPEIWAFYYLCLYNQGDRLAANNVFTELGDIIGNDSAKWLEVARLCEDRDNFDGAQHAYTQVIKRDPMNFALFDKIKALNQKKKDRAIGLY